MEIKESMLAKAALTANCVVAITMGACVANAQNEDCLSLRRDKRVVSTQKFELIDEYPYLAAMLNICSKEKDADKVTTCTSLFDY
jgi:hypothetical protein